MSLAPAAADPFATDRPRLRSPRPRAERGPATGSMATAAPASRPLDLTADFGAWIRLFEYGLLAAILVIVSGGLPALYMKVYDLLEQPGWTIYTYAFLMLGMAWGLLIRPLTVLKLSVWAWPLTALALLMMASSQWSIDPGTSWRQGLIHTAMLGSAFWAAARFSWRELAATVFWVYLALAGLSAALAVLTPQWGVMDEVYPGAWSGLWGFKQTLGVTMIIGVCAAGGYAAIEPKRTPIALFGIALMMAVIWFSQTTTAVLVGVAVIGLFVAGGLAQRHPSMAILLTWGVVAAAMLFGIAATFFGDQLFALVGKSSDFSGREGIWAGSQQLIEMRPWTGWGYQAVWHNKDPNGPIEFVIWHTGFRPADAHSSWMDIGVQLGLPGMAIMAFSFFAALWAAGRRIYSHPGALWAAVTLIAILSVSFTETILASPMGATAFLFQLMAAKLAMNEALRSPRWD
jgi:exopolysaccharide production protein ExoQ